MTPELHLMLDLETLSTRANAVILEVGYAIFETHVNAVNSSGCWRLRLEEQIDSVHFLRDISASTLVWWTEQSDEARANAFKSIPRVSIAEFLDEFQSQIEWHNIQGVWSHGLAFDVPILDDLHKQYGKVVPWHYRTPRDTRTLFWLAGMSSADFVQPTLKHSAEADAIAQAETVQLALKKMNGMHQAFDHVSRHGWNA